MATVADRHSLEPEKLMASDDVWRRIRPHAGPLHENLTREQH